MRRVLSGVVTTAVLGAVFSSFSFVLLFVYDVGWPSWRLGCC